MLLTYIWSHIDGLVSLTTKCEGVPSIGVSIDSLRGAISEKWGGVELRLQLISNRKSFYWLSNRQYLMATAELRNAIAMFG